MGSKSSDNQHRFKNRSADATLNYRIVSLADVSSDEDGFRITTRTDTQDLIHPIRQLGLIQPPVLVSDFPGYKIVCGFRRIAACRALGWSDNAWQRSLNLMETSRALNLLADVCPDQRRLAQAASALGLPVNPSLVAKVKKICRLPCKIQESILAGTVGMSMALALAELEQPDGEALLGLFNELKVGLNKQRELLILLKEIAGRENRSVQQLIAEQPLQEILTNARLDRAVKRQKIRSFLQQRRYPSISKAAADYAERIKLLDLGCNINLIPPINFEDTDFTMTLRFNNRENLRDLKKKIEELIAHPALAEILER
jgi:ParB family chromosome partitioning protein